MRDPLVSLEPKIVNQHPWLRYGRSTSIVLVFGLFGGCQKPASPPPPPKPPEVIVAFPSTEEVQEYEETTGRLVARESVEIRSRVSGYLDEAFFTDGSNVQKGDRLFQIDSREYQAELARAVAAVAQSRARLDRLKRQEERARKLYLTKNTTQEELDLISADRSEAEAALDALIAQQELAQLNRDFTQITSPITGRISRRMVDPGNLVKSDETPLVTVMSLNPIYAYFDIDERTILRVERLIREGKILSPRDSKYEVLFALADETEFERKGAIDFLDNHLSTTTGTLRLRATVENESLLLSPGMFIRVHVPIGKPHSAILIPEEALGSDQGQRFVYLVNENDEVVYRRVRIGLLKKGRRVIEEGMAPTDRVIVSGLQRVRTGVKVQPKFVGAPNAEAEPPATPEKLPPATPEKLPPAAVEKLPPSPTEPKTSVEEPKAKAEAKATTGTLGRP